MSVSSQLCMDVDAASSTRIPFTISPFPYPPPTESVNSPVQDGTLSDSSVGHKKQRVRYHRYSFPSTSVPRPQSTESMQTWPFNRDDSVAEISLPVKNSPRSRESVPGRRRNLAAARLPMLTGSTALTDSGDDVIPDVTSSDAYEYTPDTVERPSTAWMTRRNVESADLHEITSPVNSSGVHIVIDDGDDDVTYGDDVTEDVDESTSGRDSPSGDRS